MTDQPSGRPEEPVTEGLAMGPGGGPEVLQAAPPDDREAVLQFIATTYGNTDALEMLRELRGQQAAPAAAPGPAVGPAGGPAAPSAGPPTLGPQGPTEGAAGPPQEGGSLDSMLLGDETEPAAPQPVEEAQEPQGPSEPAPVEVP